jgi:hypothetical protein
MPKGSIVKTSKRAGSGKVKARPPLETSAVGRIKRPILGKGRFTAKQIRDAVRAQIRERTASDG